MSKKPNSVLVSIFDKALDKNDRAALAKLRISAESLSDIYNDDNSATTSFRLNRANIKYDSVEFTAADAAWAKLRAVDPETLANVSTEGVSDTVLQDARTIIVSIGLYSLEHFIKSIN